jgi:hypothetical protein
MCFLILGYRCFVGGKGASNNYAVRNSTLDGCITVSVIFLVLELDEGLIEIDIGCPAQFFKGDDV